MKTLKQNKMKTLTTLFCLLITSIVFAQWTTDTNVNTLVADSEGLDMQTLGTSDGQTYIVFWENVAPPTNIELRLQILDADGNQTLGSNGALVSDQIPMGTFTVTWNMVVDSEDNLYIGVTGTGGGDPAFVFKMDSSGTHLWNPNGVAIGNGNVVTILPLTAGGAVVSWLSSIGAIMQKYDENGDPVWPTTQPITTGSGFTAPANFFELSNGDFIAVFHQLIGGINSNLYAQRYDVNGDSVWANAVQLSNRATTFNRFYSGVQDGDVVYMGYFASAGTRFDSYLQRINPDGALPWGINGSDFDINETDFEMTTAIAFETGSQYVWAVANYTNSTQDQNGEYVQKFDKDTGARELTDNAKVVFPIGSDKVHVANLDLKEDSPLFLMEAGINNGVAPTTLNAVYLDENGDFVWLEETLPVATFGASKSRVQFTKAVNNQNIAVFIEDKGSGERIYAQNFVDPSLGVGDSDLILESILMFPNPANDQVSLTNQEGFQLNSASVYDVLGRLVKTFNLTDMGTHRVLDISELTKATYYVLIKGDGYQVTKQLIKK